MSKKLAEKVDQHHPELLRANVGASCYQFITLLIAELRAAGQQANYIAKVAGEGQYSPPGFGRVRVVGRDGSFYTATGVSHDAIYVNGEQFDCIQDGNDGPEPIFRDGKPLQGKPVFNPIPRHDWRPGNPPLPIELERGNPGGGPQPAPVPSRFVFPDYASMGDAAFFINEVGNVFEADYKEAKQKLNGGVADWIARTVHSLMSSFAQHGDHRNKAAIVKKHRNELREVLGLKPV